MAGLASRPPQRAARSGPPPGHSGSFPAHLAPVAGDWGTVAVHLACLETAGR